MPDQGDQALITIPDGTLRGVIETTDDGLKFFSFMGVPFAKPPLGHLKFKAPQPVEPWQGVLEANQPDHPCLSKEMTQNLILGDFDCLYVNVYTPKLPGRDRNAPRVQLPVMVMIHGGAFTMGSNNKQFYGCEYFMDKDIVIVVINYRLGALGFLSLKDARLGVSGNAGLKDQVMALKWAQKNISHFGGDPNNVTICGVSAGSASVSYLMLSPMSQGLFHKGILQSGVATCNWAQGDVNLAQELLKATGKTASNEAEMLKIFENLSKDELMDAQLKVPDVWRADHYRYLCPTIETSKTEECFISDSPENILKSGKYYKVPVIIGVTSNEGLLMYDFLANENIQPRTNEEFCPYWLNLSKEKAAIIGKQIKDFYYANKEINDDNLQCFFNYAGDTFFYRAIYAYVEEQLKTSNKEVYLYNFDLTTNLNVLKKWWKIDHHPGASHGDDMFYFLKTMMSPPIEKNSEEYLAIQKMTTWWANFAKYTNPNGNSDAVNPLLGIKWPRAAITDRRYLNISKPVTIEANYGEKVTKFWNAIEAI